MTTIIAITGKARHGKDTFYRRVLAPRDFERVALADPLKGLLLHMNMGYMASSRVDRWDMGVIHSSALRHLEKLYYGAFGANKSEEMRTDLQQIGTELVRERFDPCFWSMLALQEIRARADKGESKIAVTDCRFPDEAWAFQGDAVRLESMYVTRAMVRGLPVQSHIWWRMTHTWDEHHPDHGRGCLPPSRVKTHVFKVVRTDSNELLSESQAAHTSETKLEEIQPDQVFHAASPEELARAGDNYCRVLGIT